MWSAAKRMGVGALGITMVVGSLWARSVSVQAAVGDAKLKLATGVAGTPGSTAIVPLTYEKAATTEAGVYVATIDKPAGWSLNQTHANLEQACPASDPDCASVPSTVRKFKVSGGTGLDTDRIALIEEAGNQLLVVVMNTQAAGALANPTVLNVPLAVATGASGTLPVNFVAADTIVRDTSEPAGAASQILVELTNGSISLGGGSICDRENDGDCDLLDVFWEIARWTEEQAGTITPANRAQADVAAPFGGAIDLLDVFAVINAWVAEH